MVASSVQGHSNQPRLNNKCLLLQNTRQREKRYKGCLDKCKWLPKTSHVCSVQLKKEDHFDQSQEMKRHPLCSKLKYLLKLNVFTTLFPNGEAGNDWELPV